ncbi:hypothetical protein D5086_009388 [Populus alba]|nr:hypothetical protein D5086_0000244520 [Populus alba]
MEIPESEELQEPRNKTASSGARESKGQDGRGQGSGGGGNRLRPFVRERRKAEDLMANSSPELGNSSPSIHDPTLEKGSIAPLSCQQHEQRSTAPLIYCFGSNGWKSNT